MLISDWSSDVCSSDLLNYELRARADLDGDPGSDDDFSFICFGGDDEAKRFGHELRRRITMDVLPALRDAEGDLAAWRRSPLRPRSEEHTSELQSLMRISYAVFCLKKKKKNTKKKHHKRNRYIHELIKSQ